MQGHSERPKNLPKSNYTEPPVNVADADLSQKVTQPGAIKHKDQVNLGAFRQFDPEDLPQHFSMLFVAPRGSGKTVALRHILYKIKGRFKKAYLFSQTASFQEGAYDYIPAQNIFNGFDEFALRDIVNKNKEILTRNKSLPKKLRIDNPVLVVLDDVVTDKAMQTSETLKSLFTLGRHIHISVVILLQNISSRDGMSTICRKNVDCFFGWSTHDALSREMISESFASIINKKEGMCVLSAICEEQPYQACVCLLRNKKHGKSPINRYEDYIYKYLAPAKPCRPYKIGTKQDIQKSKVTRVPNEGRGFQF